jgi:hypothetical protein
VYRLTELAGYRVLGRQGELGRVVNWEGLEGASESSTLIVRGGVSGALVYHVPAMRLIGVSRETGTVSADVDVADFIARFGEGGTVELRMVGNTG